MVTFVFNAGYHAPHPLSAARCARHGFPNPGRYWIFHDGSRHVLGRFGPHEGYEIWLVGQGHPSEKYEFVNWDDNRNPIYMGK